MAKYFPTPAIEKKFLALTKNQKQGALHFAKRRAKRNASDLDWKPNLYAVLVDDVRNAKRKK